MSGDIRKIPCSYLNWYLFYNCRSRRMRTGINLKSEVIIIMLSKFRKGADSIFVRILLGFIALSFLGFGASSFLGGNSRGDAVTFSKAPAISMEEFLTIKARQIERIGRENNVNLTEEQIKELNIDHQILQQLVNDAMIKYLAKIYDFEISENLVINFVKKMPYFQNKDGNFDIKAFKTAFRNSQRQEDEYLENLKTGLVKSIVLDVFMESFKPSKIMVDNVVNHMAETKFFDLVSIDLTRKNTDFQKNQISPEELEEFYKKNENDFVLPELRSFDYVTIDKDFFSKKIKIEEADMKVYYEENKNDFEDKPYMAVKKDVLEVLFNAKLEELLTGLAKTLEEDVAAGMVLKDLAAKHVLKISSVSGVTQIDLGNDAKLGIGEAADSIFEMAENEVSYPFELPEQHKIILAQLKNITPARKQEFAEVKELINSILQERAVITANAKILEDAQRIYDPAKINPETLKNKGVVVETNKSLTRVDMQTEAKINPEIAYLVFTTAKNHVTSLIRIDNKAYFAFVKDSKVNKEKAKIVADTSREQIAATIKESVMQELIGYLTEENKMKVQLK